MTNLTNNAIDMTAAKSNVVSMTVARDNTAIEMAHDLHDSRDQVVNQVYATHNYDQFHLMESNRKVSKARVNKVRKSIETVGLLPYPIAVNHNMEIIDGQARYTVCKEKGLPVYYCMGPGGVEECRNMNNASTNWKGFEYVKSYANSGRKSFVYLQKLFDKYPLNYSVILSVCKDTTGSTREESVMDGSFHVDVADYMEIEATLDYLTGLSGKINKTRGRKGSLYSAAAFAYRHADMNIERLTNAVSKAALDAAASDISIGDTRYAMQLIEKAYNTGLSYKRRVDLVGEYEDWVHKVGKYANR